MGVTGAVAFFALGYPGLYLEGVLGQLRYLIYAAPFALIAPHLYMDASSVNRVATSGLVLYAASAFIFFVVNGGEVAHNFWINATLIPLAILGFVPDARAGRRHIELMFWVILVCSALSFMFSAHGSIRLLAILSSGTGTGLVDAYGNHEGLVAPLFALFFHAVGAQLYALAAVAISVIGGKRIGLLALVAGLLVLYTLRRVRRLDRARSRIVLLLVALSAINAASVNMLQIAETFHRTLGLKVPIEEIMLGRHNLAREINRSLEVKPLLVQVFGSGPGAAESLAGDRLKNGAAYLPHNDWLKIRYDYGVAGSILVIIGMTLVFSTSAVAVALGITSAIVMMTDNVIIYVFFQLPIAVMLAYLRWGEGRDGTPL
ncbi:MAG: hypothetical protein NW216_03005 [Hyphomicrobium sp.]|nr:hypothetical protein [Hyphomicrobium sp.]